MAGARLFEVRLAVEAFDDLAAIWKWTVRRFDQAAALRYEELIDCALGDLGDDPRRLGAKLRSDLMPGLWIIISFTAGRTCRKNGVSTVRATSVMFRHLEPRVIEVVRILHDSRYLRRHLPD